MGTPASGESLRSTLGHISVSAFALAGIVIANLRDQRFYCGWRLIKAPARDVGARKTPQGIALRDFPPSLPDSVDKLCISRVAAAGSFQHT